MAGLFDTLGIATRGLQVVQRGMATTGHNIANVDTPGYSKQRAVLATGLPQPDATGTVGSGVEQVTVQRIIDRFIGFRLVSETSRKAELETQSTIYREVETIVNDQLAPGLTDELTNFFGAIDERASAQETGQSVARGTLLSSAESLVDTVRRYDARLRTLQRDADRGITGMLPDINSLTREIAELNGQIAEAETISPANDLRDRRDQLILALSEKIEIVSVDDVDGMASIRIAGGLSLVDKRVAAELTAVVDAGNPHPFDPTFSQVYYEGAGSFFDATSLIKGGELGGLIDARDNIVAGTIRELDAFAFTLASEFNAVHRTGYGLVDTAAHDFFLDLSTATTIDDTARNFALSADIDPDQGGTLDHIAAADALNLAGTAGAIGNTSAALALGDLRTTRVQTYLPGDVPGTPTGDIVSISGRLINIVGDLGQKARSTSRALEQQEAVLSAVQDRRDSVSGVSIDEEVADLVKLQANFQANARVVRTVSTLLQDLFDAI